MLLKAVDAISGKAVLEIGYEGECVGPNAGDLLVTPDKKQFRVLQRAFIAHEFRNTATGQVVDFSAPKAIDFELQLAVCPVGAEAEYSAKLMEA